MFKLEIDVSADTLVNEKRNLKKALRQVGNLVARKARTLITRSTAPSKPGQPPAGKTGALRSSIRVRPNKDGTSVAVRDTQFYALFLEKGARGGGGRKRKGRNKRGVASTKRVLEPRPFLSTALEQTKAITRNKLTDAAVRDIGAKK